MLHPRRYRQEVPTFRAELDRVLAVPEASRSGRLIIDTKGYQSRTPTAKSNDEKMAIYGYERFESVARVLGVFGILRDLEGLHTRHKEVLPTASGAVWQAFKGTKDSNACHTCPSHLQLDGHLPTLMTRNVGLQRHIIVEFANCILMPRTINEIDKVFDEQAGKSAFVDAATLILNESGMTWREGVESFREGVGDFLGPAHDILFDPSTRRITTRTPEEQAQVDMFSAYYEGIFLRPLNIASVNTMLKQAETDAGQQSSSVASPSKRT